MHVAAGIGCEAPRISGYVTRMGHGITRTVDAVNGWLGFCAAGGGVSAVAGYCVRVGRGRRTRALPRLGLAVEQVLMSGRRFTRLGAVGAEDADGERPEGPEGPEELLLSPEA